MTSDSDTHGISTAGHWPWFTSTCTSYTYYYYYTMLNTGIYMYKLHLLLLHVQVTLIITTKLLVLVACSLCRVYLSSLRPCRGKDCKNYSTLTARGAARTDDAPGSSDGELDRGR